MSEEIDDSQALGMENDLLAHQARVMRAHNIDLTTERDTAVDIRNRTAEDHADVIRQLREARAELEEAKADLKRLLKRLGSGPLGVVLRRRQGFRAMRDRWLK